MSESRVDKAMDWLVRPWMETGTASGRIGRVCVVGLAFTIVLLPGMILYFGIDGWWWDTTLAVPIGASLGIMLFDQGAELAGRLAGRRIVGVARVAVLFVGLAVGVLCGYAAVMFGHDLPGRSVDLVLKDYRRTMAILLPVLTVAAIAGASLWYRGEASRLESALAKASFSALKGQMQPHFLFNALNSLKELIADDPALAADVTQRIADLYRLILKASNEPTAPLSDELAIVTSYLEVERVRFGDRLRYRIEVPDELGALHVPSLVLQTLVENAVKHGVCKARQGGEVCVKAARKPGGPVQLEVSNTGAPYAPSAARNPASAPPTGLANTRARLELMYGSAHDFSITSDDKLGTRVTFAVSGAKVG